MIQDMQNRLNESQKSIKDSSDHIKRLERDNTNILKSLQDLENDNSKLRKTIHTLKRERSSAKRGSTTGSKKRKKKLSLKHHGVAGCGNQNHSQFYRMLKLDSHSATSTKNMIGGNSYFLKPNVSRRRVIPKISSLRKKIKRKSGAGHQTASNSITISKDKKMSVLNGIFSTDRNIMYDGRKVNPRRYKNSSIV